MRRPAILILDSSRSIRDMLRLTLGQHYVLDAVATDTEARALLRQDTHTACIIQIQPAEIAERLALLRSLHHENPRRLILALGDQRPLSLAADCYEAGAHGFIPKSGHIVRELNALLHRLLALPGFTHHKESYRDGLPLPSAPFDWARTRIDPATMKAHFPNGRLAAVTAKQTAILHYFATHPDKVYHRAAMLVELWGQHAPTAKALDVQIMRLRHLFSRNGHTLPLTPRPKIGWQYSE